MNQQHALSTEKTLEQVDERRRGFLAKLLFGTAAAAATVPMMTSIALADDELDDEMEGVRGKGKGGKGKGGEGKGGEGRGGAGQMRDPASMAEMWMKNHDKDRDGKLDMAELTDAFKAMQAQRQAGGGKGKGGKGKGKGGKGKGGINVE